MDPMSPIRISASGLAAQKKRMEAISSNIANIQTTQTPEGGPYRRKEVVLEAKPFSAHLDDAARKVNVKSIQERNDEPIFKYDPGHPDANNEGYVAYPNINLSEEMADMMTATRAYEANITAIKSSRRMLLKTLEIGR